jgi:catechol 2,3-dioxygenase-like lactoylglutathione lyase family enzyme
MDVLPRDAAAFGRLRVYKSSLSARPERTSRLTAKEERPMDSMIDSLFEQYDRGGLTRRRLVQALAALVLPASVLTQSAAQTTAQNMTQTAAQDTAPAPEPLVRGLGVNHIGLTVSDIERSSVFYQKLFGVKKGWPATNAGTGIHLDFPVGYISVDSVAPNKGVITHFSISIDHIDQDSGKALADKINAALPDAKARSAFQANDGVTTVNLLDPDGFHVQISPKDGH